VKAASQTPAESAFTAEADKPNGPVAAVMLAAGFGSLVLGILTTVAEASEGFKSSIEYVARVGPLSGKVFWSMGAFLVAWIALGFALRDRNLVWKTVVWATVAMVVLGLIGTFPTFFQAFAPAE